MERGRRTVILGIDNRAAEIAARHGASPVIPRNRIVETLRRWIAGSGPVELTIPTDAVSRWKQELSAAMSMPERINRAA